MANYQLCLFESPKNTVENAPLPIYFSTVKSFIELKYFPDLIIIKMDKVDEKIFKFKEKFFIEKKVDFHEIVDKNKDYYF